MFKALSSFWYLHGFNILVMATVLFFLLYWVFVTRHKPQGSYATSYYYDPIEDDFLHHGKDGLRANPNPSRWTHWKNKSSSPDVHGKPRSPRQVTQTSRGEVICKNYAEYIFQRPFTKCRPSFLYNTVTHENLELDCYNDDLKIAIEYNGRQHYEYVPFFHGNSRTNFHNQKYRDEKKADMCKKQGIHLIVVPYTVPHEKIPKFLKQELTRRGLYASPL